MAENEKNPKNDQSKYKKSVSLFGVKFEEVVAALLKPRSLRKKNMEATKAKNSDKPISAIQVAGYILKRAEADEELVSNLQLQKLLYYMQGFHLAIFDKPLFVEDIVHWMHGPAIPEVYEQFKNYGRNAIDYPDHIDMTGVSDDSLHLMDEVYDVYGQFSAGALLSMTHSEPPWLKTTDYEVITHEALLDYFKTQITDDGEEG